MTTFKIGEDSFELASVDTWTLKENRLAMELSGGMTPIELAENLGKMHPDAVNAFLMVSIRRGKPDAPDDYLDDVALTPILELLGEAAEEAERPTSAPAKGATGSSKRSTKTHA